MADKDQTKKLIKPTSNKIQISAKRDPGFYIFLSKLFLMDFEEVELHALGDAISTGVKVSEQLCRFEYATMGRCETLTIAPGDEDDKDEDGKALRRGKKAKLIVSLKRSKKFPELIKNFKIQKA